LVGVFTQRHLTNILTSKRHNLETLIKKAFIKEYKVLKSDDKLSRLSKSFNRHHFVIIQDGKKLSIAEPSHLLESFMGTK